MDGRAPAKLELPIAADSFRVLLLLMTSIGRKENVPCVGMAMESQSGQFSLVAFCPQRVFAVDNRAGGNIFYTS